jgi:hypothetical protein
MKELQKNSICLHASANLLRFRPQTIPPLLFSYAIKGNRGMSTEYAFCNQPFKSFVVAWMVGGSFPGLVQHQKSHSELTNRFCKKHLHVRSTLPSEELDVV